MVVLVQALDKGPDCGVVKLGPLVCWGVKQERPYDQNKAYNLNFLKIPFNFKLHLCNLANTLIQSA